MASGGKPAVDRAKASLTLVTGLCKTDFPSTSPTFGATGQITPRAR
jgi:hypothetical protein